MSNKSGNTGYQSPSNIALVKYWGKKDGIQIPANPSLSMTLSVCHTRTILNYSERQNDDAKIELTFEGKPMDSFLPKINQFIDRVANIYPQVRDFDLQIRSENSFPHSSGIASSASSMSALALCIMDMLLNSDAISELSDFERLKAASQLARLGSGSAARSLFPHFAGWGEFAGIEGSSDLYGYPVSNVNEVFNGLKDTVLIIDEGKKAISSTLGSFLTQRPSFC